MLRLRAWPLLSLVALSVALAGCTSSDMPPEPAPAQPAPSPPESSQPPAAREEAPPVRPVVAPVADKGAIQGPFAKKWTLTLPQVGVREMNVDFKLTGAQAGAPPTARLVLKLVGPEGEVLKSATVGLGGSANQVAWALSGADVPMAGDYVLEATSESAQGHALPSGGLGNYELAMGAQY